MLLDVSDRMGSISLHEVLMKDRKDVAEFLITKHGTSIHTTDMDGVSPMTMVTNGGQMSSKHVSAIILDVARKEGKQARNAKKQRALYTCAECGNELQQGAGKQCAGCKQKVYCNRDCQVHSWRAGHHKECKALQALTTGVKIHRPSHQDKVFPPFSCPPVGHTRKVPTGNRFGSTPMKNLWSKCRVGPSLCQLWSTMKAGRVNLILNRGNP